MRLGPPASLMPVIKADAYGHGLLPVAQALATAGAKRFAVGIAAEGEELRKAGLNQQIIPLLGCLDKEDWEKARSLTPLIGSFADLETARQLAPVNGFWDIALKFDTGMGRLGFDPEETGSLIESLAAAPTLRPALAISHLACADMPDEAGFTQAQKTTFKQIFQLLKSHYPEICMSLANSAALCSGCNETEISRPGLALYGGNPLPGDCRCELEWAMSVSAPILQTRRLKPGQSVSYGRTFTADREMVVAIIGAGYAQGLNRALSNRMPVLVNGRRARQIGRICMGMSLIDITEAHDVGPGDRVWLLGGEASPGEKPVTAQELADILGTIPYEILCLMGSLNPRRYEGCASAERS